MGKGNVDIQRLQAQLHQTTFEFLRLVKSFDKQEINMVPFEKSWSAAQVADHVTKSNISIAKALLLEGTPINREPGERVKELKEVFLDFSTRFKSPSFILPTQDIYEKEIVVSKLESSIEKIKELAGKTDLTEMINHPAFGDITKLEILHFVLYHTKRHAHQLENIFRALTKIKSS